MWSSGFGSVVFLPERASFRVRWNASFRKRVQAGQRVFRASHSFLHESMRQRASERKSPPPSACGAGSSVPRWYGITHADTRLATVLTRAALRSLASASNSTPSHSASRQICSRNERLFSPIPALHERTGRTVGQSTSRSNNPALLTKHVYRRRVNVLPTEVARAAAWNPASAIRNPRGNTECRRSKRQLPTGPARRAPGSCHAAENGGTQLSGNTRLTCEYDRWRSSTSFTTIERPCRAWGISRCPYRFATAPRKGHLAAAALRALFTSV